MPDDRVAYQSRKFKLGRMRDIDILTELFVLGLGDILTEKTRVEGLQLESRTCAMETILTSEFPDRAGLLWEQRQEPMAAYGEEPPL